MVLEEVEMRSPRNLLQSVDGEAHSSGDVVPVGAETNVCL